MAALVDSLACVASFVPGVVVAVVGSAAVAPEPDLPPWVAVAVAVLIIAGFVAWLFNVCWTQGHTGQSWGKRVAGIHLIREDRFMAPGGGVGVARFVVRNVLGNATCGVYSLLTVLWPLWDERSQTIDDKIVHTLVVRLQRQVQG